MSLLLLTVTLRGVSNKHCLLSFFFICLSLHLGEFSYRFLLSQNSTHGIIVSLVLDKADLKYKPNQTKIGSPIKSYVVGEHWDLDNMSV